MLRTQGTLSHNYFFIRHAIMSGSPPLPRTIKPRFSSASTVLRFADDGRITSSLLESRSTGLPPSESVSSRQPCSMCDRRSLSAGDMSVRLRASAAFFLRATPGDFFSRASLSLLLFCPVACTCRAKCNTASTQACDA